MLQEEIRRIIREPEKVYDEMLKNNPAFRAFVEENKNKTIEQMIRESGIHI